MEINKDTLSKFRIRLTNDLDKISKEYGIVFNIGRITYTENKFSCKLECAVSGSEGLSVIAVDFKEQCGKYGFEFTDLGRKFTSNDNVYEIVGLKPRNRKYPIIAKKLSDGKQYKFNENMVKIALNKG